MERSVHITKLFEGNGVKCHIKDLGGSIDYSYYNRYVICAVHLLTYFFAGT